MMGPQACKGVLLFGAGTATGTGLVRLADLDLGVGVTLLFLVSSVTHSAAGLLIMVDMACPALNASDKNMSWLDAEHDVHSGIIMTLRMMPRRSL